MLFRKRRKKDGEKAAAVLDAGAGRHGDDGDELFAVIAAAVAAVMGSGAGAGCRYRIRSFRPSGEWAAAGRYESMRPRGAV